MGYAVSNVIFHGRFVIFEFSFFLLSTRLRHPVGYFPAGTVVSRTGLRITILTFDRFGRAEKRSGRKKMTRSVD